MLPVPTSTATHVGTLGLAGDFLIKPLATNNASGTIPAVNAPPSGQGWRDEDFYTPNQDIASVQFAAGNWLFRYSLAMSAGTVPTVGQITVIAYAIDPANATRELFRHTSGGFTVSPVEANFLDVFNPGVVTLNPGEIIQYELWWTVVSGLDVSTVVAFRAGGAGASLSPPSITATAFSILATGAAQAHGGGIGQINQHRAALDAVIGTGGGVGRVTGTRTTADFMVGAGGGGQFSITGKHLEQGVTAGTGGGVGRVTGTRTVSAAVAVGDGGGSALVSNTSTRSTVVVGDGGGGVLQFGYIVTRQTTVAAGGGGRDVLTGFSTRHTCATPIGLAGLIPAVIEALLELLGLTDEDELLCTTEGSPFTPTGGGLGLAAGAPLHVAGLIVGAGGGNGRVAGVRLTTAGLVGDGGGGGRFLGLTQLQTMVVGTGGGGGFASGVRSTTGTVQCHGGGLGPNIGARLIAQTMQCHGAGGAAPIGKGGRNGFCLGHGGGRSDLDGFSTRRSGRPIQGGGTCQVAGNTTTHFGSVRGVGGGACALGAGVANLVQAACLDIDVVQHTRVKLCVRSATDVGLAAQPMPQAHVRVTVRCRS